MKVLFLKDVPGSGEAGDVKEVARGFGRNYLLPRGLAIEASPGAMKQAESRILQEKERKVEEAKRLETLAGKLQGKELLFKARVGSEDKLFGSITAAHIAEELSTQAAATIDKKHIALDRPLREIGSHEVLVRFSANAEATVTVTIEPETDE